MTRSTALLLVVLLLVPVVGRAARHAYSGPASRFKLLFTGETLWNVRGGLKTGNETGYLANAIANLNTARLGWWSGGTLRLDMEQILTDQPSQTLIGDVQTESNIAARSTTQLYELWYEQRFAGRQAELRAGIINLNNVFAVVPGAGQLVNSSFGITPSVSLNVPTSIYPKPGLGALLRAASGEWEVNVGVFQGHPGRRDRAFSGGRMVIGELARRFPGAAASTRLALGVWQYSAPGVGSPTAPSHTWGTYLIATHSLVQPGGGPPRATFFAELGVSPPAQSINPYHLAIGVALRDLWHRRTGDQLTVGATRAWLRRPGGESAETAYEITYMYVLGPHLALQPDVQYITHPLGAARPLPAALVFSLRVNAVLSLH